MCVYSKYFIERKCISIYNWEFSKSDILLVQCMICIQRGVECLATALHSED